MLKKPLRVDPKRIFKFFLFALRADKLQLHKGNELFLWIVFCPFLGLY